MGTAPHEGAVELAAHPVYAHYAQYLLAHSPRTIADRHYLPPSDEQFFAALRWLGVRYGILKFLARLGYPYTRIVQRRFARDSAAAMRRAVGRA